MQKNWLLLYLLLGWGLSLHGQTLTNAVPNPIAPGYTGTLTITGANTLFSRSTRGLSLHLEHANTGQLYEFGASQPWIGGWCTTTDDTLASGTITLPGNAPTGAYHVELRGYGYYGPNLTVIENNLLIVTGNAANFNGKIVYDLDSNCTQNGLDLGVGNQIVLASPGGYMGVTDLNGSFSISLPTGTYTFSTGNPTGATLICPAAPFTQTATMNTLGGTISGIDFYAKPSIQADIGCMVVAGNHRPGFTNNWVNVRVFNNSLHPALNCTLRVAKPSAFSFTSFIPAPTSVNGDTVIWTFGPLSSLGYSNFGIMMTVPTITPLGTPYTYWTDVTTPATESDLVNNEDVFSDVVVGSYDPNDKQVWTLDGENADGPIDPLAMRLRYLIRFQNTGTDTAFNIAIADQLDADLDARSIEIEGSSDPVQLVFTDSTGRDLRFEFADILLPDSNVNEPASHGYVRYSIDRKPNLPIGTRIENVAGIYFDFNAPIITNTVVSTLCNPLGNSFTQSVNSTVVTFTAPPQGLPTSWAWDFGDGNTSAVAAPTHTYDTSGVYTVCLTIGNDCGRVETICSNVYIGIVATENASEAIQSLSLSPNPGREAVQLDLTANRLRSPRFELRDIQGKLVTAWTEDTIVGKYAKQLDVAAYAPGLYFLHIHSLETQFTVKLMVE